VTTAPDLAHYLEAGNGESSPVAALRRFLEAVRAHLREVHLESRSGTLTNRAGSDLLDHLVSELYARAQAQCSSGEPEPLAMVAVGGFGRREMALHSDVDLLFLHPDPLADASAAVAEQVQYWLWDAGLSIGCSIRTAQETCELAREDVTVATSILDARHLAGDPGLVEELEGLVAGSFADGAYEFVAGQAASRQERHSKFGESLYLLQPNVKEGEGGLRDYHGALWVMRAVEPAARRLGGLARAGLLTLPELEELKRALDFLWRVRNELHWMAGRRSDQMSFASQEQLALGLGYGPEDSARDLPVERFMGDFYRHARVIRNDSDLVFEQCLARARPLLAVPTPQPVADGFRKVGDHLEIPSGAHLQEHPERLLGAFAAAQEHDVPLSRTALRLVRENLDLIDDAYRARPEASALFFGILAAEQRVFRTLTALNEVGLLARYLPEWDHITCRWQHVMYHTYTVDVHTTFLVEELRRLWRGKYETGLPELTELVRSVEDRVVLFLGCLFHDIGKGLGGNHSQRGVGITRAALERLGLDPERIERVVFLVEHHLTMPHVAQRRDLSDPRVIVEFARLVGDRENLRNLYLVTFADTRASSPEAWTEWKGRLLRELFERTSEFLETGGEDASQVLEQIERQVATIQAEARQELSQLGVGAAKVEAFFDALPRRYFVSHEPREIARHALLVISFAPRHRVAMSVREMAGGTTELILCAPDVHGLYAMVAGTLTSRELNILGSSVYTLRSGLALEVYRISTPAGGEAERKLAWKNFEAALSDVVAGEVDVEQTLRRRKLPLGRGSSPGRRPPSVKITNAESDFYTIVDITANDRMGLLYDLTRAISDASLGIYVSKASTVLDQVADTFYLKDARRHKIQDPGRLAELQRALEAVVAQAPEAHD
jgi:[protein-PII] uridylyltransferase